MKIVDAFILGGEGPLLITFQQAARDEFGLVSETFYTPAKVRAAERKFGAVQDGMRAFVRAMYENTQEALARDGVDEVVVYRGMATLRWAEGRAPEDLVFDEQVHRADIVMKPQSSWTTSLDEAMKYANERSYANGAPAMVMAARVPRERILATGLTGAAHKAQAEVAVLGGEHNEVWYAGKAQNPAIGFYQLGLLHSGTL